MKKLLFYYFLSLNNSLKIYKMSTRLIELNQRHASIIEQITEDPINYHLYLERADLDRQSGRYLRALDGIEKTIALKPDSWKCYLERGLVEATLLEHGKPVNSLKFAKYLEGKENGTAAHYLCFIECDSHVLKFEKFK